MDIIEKIDNYLNEGKPVSEKGALKYVFKLPETGKFTAEFLDGTRTEIIVDEDEKSSGKYAFVGKKNGRIFKTWNKVPSAEEAAKVLRRIKFHGSKKGE